MRLDEFIDGRKERGWLFCIPLLEILDKLADGVLLAGRRLDWVRDILRGHVCLPLAVYATANQLFWNLLPRIQKVTDSAALARAGADEFVKAALHAVEDRGSFSVALSGGSTPKKMFSLLVDDARVPWDKIQFFWGDERHVPPDHPDSNYRMATETMLSKVPIGDTQIWRIHAEHADAGQAANEYEAVLRQQLGESPVLDLVMLGMGPEGHTASLFPGTKALGETTRLVVSNWVGKLYTDRITMTAQVLNNARAILFLIGGEDKALALKGVLEGPVEPDQLPAQMLLSSGDKCLWLIDETAGKMLSTANI